FVGFSQMGVEEIAAETGLTLAAAKNAAKREYSEPGLWIGDERQFSVFCETLERAGLQILQGGRFLHVMGRTNKSERMAQLKAAYQKTNPGAQILTAALGDAPNDAAMIEAADFGFIIANPHGKTMRRLPGEATGRIIRTTEPGPAGWNSAMNGLFDQLDIGTGKET
ncbi:MAG: mannosyl-3-phosphoglycerate phosphatase, partial [Pseudomonadota bacterium]